VRGRGEIRREFLAFHQQYCDQYQCLTGQRSGLYRKSLPIMMEPLNHTRTQKLTCCKHTHTYSHIDTLIHTQHTPALDINVLRVHSQTQAVNIRQRAGKYDPQNHDERFRQDTGVSTRVMHNMCSRSFTLNRSKFCKPVIFKEHFWY